MPDQHENRGNMVTCSARELRRVGERGFPCVRRQNIPSRSSSPPSTTRPAQRLLQSKTCHQFSVKSKNLKFSHLSGLRKMSTGGGFDTVDPGPWFEGEMMQSLAANSCLIVELCSAEMAANAASISSQGAAASTEVIKVWLQVWVHAAR